jgi:xanthine dehydrogenase accessory factor
MNTPEEFTAVYAGAQRLAASGGGAIATLLRTRGPVFRRAGTRMLIGVDGSIVRGLSAGCPEADLVTRARALFDDGGGACIVRYDRDHGYDALLELGCGGEMEILVETFSNVIDLDYLGAVDTLMHQRRSGWLASWYATDGHVLPRVRRLLWSSEVRFNALGDAALSDALVARGAASPPDSTSALTLDLGGRRVDVLLEPVAPPLALYVIGDNAGARALAQLGSTLGWRVAIVSHLDDAGATMPAGVVRLQAPPGQMPPQLQLDRRSAVVVMTHNLERDIDYLRTLRGTDPGYLGALGSRVRAERMRAALGDDASRLRAPAGLDIGSETPEEIALAIAAEIKAVLHGHGGGALSLGDGPIH